MSGLAIPKPAKRGPKPRRPIARTSKPARVRKTARGKARHAADLEWAKAIRESGPCAAQRARLLWAEDSSEGIFIYEHRMCFGQIEAAHILPRRYAATRTDRRNGLPLCHAAHSMFTRHPVAWALFVTNTIGKVAYGALKQKALAGPKAAA